MKVRTGKFSSPEDGPDIDRLTKKFFAKAQEAAPEVIDNILDKSDPEVLTGIITNLVKGFLVETFKKTTWPLPKNENYSRSIALLILRSQALKDFKAQRDWQIMFPFHDQSCDMQKNQWRKAVTALRAETFQRVALHVKGLLSLNFIDERKSTVSSL